MCIRDRAEAGVSEAARIPQANLSADATRERLSQNGIFPPPFAGSTSTLSDLAAVSYTHLDVYKRQVFIDPTMAPA